jgi:hypothetical protein
VDERFKVPSTEARGAVELAAKLVPWCKVEANKASFAKFSQWLTSALQTCFKPSRSLRVRKEKMWQEFHELRTSHPFLQEWDKFLKMSVCGDPLPTLFQFVTNSVFKKLIKNKYAASGTVEDQEHSSLTWEEENALRYVAGYVCRKVQGNIKKSSLEEKEDIMFLIMELSGDETCDAVGAELWTNGIDRGGLWHVNDNT